MNNRMFACCRVICGDAFYGIKNAGGNPPATSTVLVNGEAKGIAKGNPSTLGQPSIAECCFVYITMSAVAAKKEAPYQPFRKTIAKTVTVDGLDIFVSYPSQGRLFTSLMKLQEMERPRPFRKTAQSQVVKRLLEMTPTQPYTF